MAWLSVGGDPAFDDRGRHFAARLLKDSVVSYARRAAAREAAKADPQYAELLSWEIAPGSGEPSDA